MWLIYVFAIDKDIMKINNEENSKLFGQHLINITLKPDQSGEKTKKTLLIT